MSQASQVDLERIVDSYYQRHQAALKLESPIFRNDGFISTATMSGLDGYVEIRCGPAEYHAEIFVTTLKEPRRWSLDDLMRVERVRNWMFQKQTNASGKSRLEAEVDCAFCLLADGLKGVATFEWLYYSQ